MKKVGIVGCGCISGIYLHNLSKVFRNVEIYAVADLIKEREDKAAAEYNVPHILKTDDLLNDKNIDIVLNITQPKFHYDICMQALKAGKNVHVEKPLSLNRDQGAEIIALAKEKGLLVGCAPDTFMGGGIQTARKLIDDGWIGEPIAATAFMTCHGHESWHPDPEFYYEVGGGPMFDMGPYYLTALVNLIGPVESVMGETRKTFPTRTITSEPKYGKIVEVEVPTHIAGLLNFKNGAIGTIITTFDVWAAELPRIEIYGTKGSISVPDPNGFGGEVKIMTPDTNGWQNVPLCFGYQDNSRGVGLADMAQALEQGRINRPSGNLGFHVLDIMQSLHESADQGKRLVLTSTCEKPAPMTGEMY